MRLRLPPLPRALPRALVLAAAALPAALPACANAEPEPTIQVLVGVQLEVDGRRVSSPRIVLDLGETARAEQEDERGHATVVEIDEELNVTVTLPVYAADGTLAGTPTVTVAAGKDAELRFGEPEHHVVVRTTRTALSGVTTGYAP